MNLTKQEFARWILISLTLLFLAALIVVVLSYFGHLRIGRQTSYSLAQVIGAAAATATSAMMLVRNLRGHESLAGIAILAISFLFPLYFVDEAFRYSLPQAIWLPFALALAICSIRWAVLTFVTTLIILFAYFPIADITTPVTTTAVTAMIFIVLTLGRLLQQSLTERALAAEKTARDSENALRKSEERYRTVFQQTVDAISVSRIDNGICLEANDAFFAMTGYDPTEIIGQADVTKNIWENPDQRQEMLDLLSRHGEVRNFEASFRRKDGSLYWGLTSSRVMDIDGVPCRISVVRDISERKKADELIHFLAYFDQLTRLPNRTLLMDRLRQAMASNAQNATFGALLLIDLDDFKILNDTRGHESGDLLLKQVAERLTGCAGPEATVARLGGDEFVLMLTDLGETEQDATMEAEACAERVASVLRQDFPLNTGTHSNTASIGVCLFSGPETGTEALMKQAELAMYSAKHTGKNLIRFFDSAMEAAVVKRAALETDLRGALVDNQLVLHYQAQVFGQQLAGAEVLVRWQHPQKGMISPAEFIPLAEESGLIIPLGLWVLENACAQLAKWSNEPHLANLTIAVNVSVQQFNQGDFVEQVLAVLHKTGANPTRLKLELTESLLASKLDVIIEKMHALKAKGICFSLDDFGTGYSSLSYLKRLPIDQLKIDQTFVRDLLVNRDDVSIAKTIIELGENLGIGIIAEGVETAEHQAFLAGLGCTAYQGYFFGRPMPINDFEQQQEFARLRAVTNRAACDW